MEPTNKHSRVLKWSIIIGIVIVLNLFFNYTLSLFYKSPQYETYCPNTQVVSPPTNQNQCIAKGGQWTENVYPQTVEGPPTKVTPAQVTGYCNQNYTCQNNFEASRKIYERNVFVVLVALGILSILVAIFWRAAGIVSIALSLGGVLSILIAAIRYWGEAQNLLRVVILALALLALIWVAIKKFKE